MARYSRLVLLHAEQIQVAAKHERAARRLSGPERELEADMAVEARERAADLAEVLVQVGAPIVIPEPGQLSLLADGGRDHG